MNDDTLTWWEEVPLFLLVAGQMLVVFEWYTGFLVWDAIKVVFGLLAAVALDGAVVAATRGRRLGRGGFWGWLTPAAAAVFSALVALNRYDVLGQGAEGWLHAAYPVTSFIYAQHLAQRRAPSAQAHAEGAQPAQTTVNVTQVAVNVPDTVAGFIRDRARALRVERPGISLSELATLLSTSRDTVRRALEGDEIPAYLPTPEGVTTLER